MCRNEYNLQVFITFFTILIQIIVIHKILINKLFNLNYLIKSYQIYINIFFCEKQKKVVGGLK